MYLWNSDNTEDTPVIQEKMELEVIEGTVNADSFVTIDGVTYTQFIQANTPTNAGGLVPDNGTATYVFFT